MNPATRPRTAKTRNIGVLTVRNCVILDPQTLTMHGPRPRPTRPPSVTLCRTEVATWDSVWVPTWLGTHLDTVCFLAVPTPTPSATSRELR